jgi:hypothetical protein
VFVSARIVFSNTAGILTGDILGKLMIDCDTDQHLEEREIQGMQAIRRLGTTVPVVFFDYRLTIAKQQQASSGG